MKKNLIIIALLIFSACIFINCSLNMDETQPLSSSNAIEKEGIIIKDNFSLPADTEYIVDQDNKNSITRIKTTGSEPSIIKGSLKAAGTLIIDNPNGIVIEEAALIEAAQFTAITEGSAGIIQRGTIRVAGGLIALEPPHGDVEQSGTLAAEGSTVPGGISIFAQNIYLKESSQLIARGTYTLNGEEINIESTALTEVRGLVDASSNKKQTQGDRILLLLDNKIILFNGNNNYEEG